MVRIFSLSLIQARPSQRCAILSTATDLSSFSFYQRGSVGEFMSFFSKVVAERTPQGQRQSIEENNYVTHTYNRGGDGALVAVVITDQEYPSRAAFSLLNKLLDDFTTKFPQQPYTNHSFPEITSYLEKYQDPRQVDTVMKIQQELDETKIVLHKTIESILERGEKLDTLVEQSAALSSQTKMFYQTAKRKNSCCVIM